MPDVADPHSAANGPGDNSDGTIQDAPDDEHFYHLPYIQWADDIPGQNAYPSEPSLDDDSSSESEEASLPEGWRVHIHPNGSLYYENEARHLTSNYDLRSNPRALATIIERLGISSKLDMREDHWEIYLGSRGFIWVDHLNQSASTPGQDPEDFSREIENGGIVSQLKRQNRYWTYVQSHPNHVPQAPLKTAWQEAHDALVWCHAERVLFQQTNATFSREDSRELLEILTRLRDVDLGSSERSSAYHRTHGSSALRTWFMAAVLRQIAHDRLCTHHGQPDAPQHRQREADDMHAERGEFGFRIALLYYVVGTAMFLGIPHSYHRRILSVDKTDTGYGVNSMRWKAFLGSMLKEWTDSNLLATVLISATVGFLAIPGIEDNSRMMGLFAVLLAIGSVLTGMLFIWHHQPRANSTAEVAVNYFRRAKRLTRSPVPLAFILSIPIVLLLWSFLCFVSAILIFAFRGWQQTADGMFTAFSKATSPSTVAMLSLVLGTACIAWIFMWRVWTPLTRRGSSGRLGSRTLHPLGRLLKRFWRSCTTDEDLEQALPPPGGLRTASPNLPGLQYNPSPGSAMGSPHRPSSRLGQRSDSNDSSSPGENTWAPLAHQPLSVQSLALVDEAALWQALPYALDSPEIAPISTVTAGRRQPELDAPHGHRRGRSRGGIPRSSSQSSLSSIGRSSTTRLPGPQFAPGRPRQGRNRSSMGLLPDLEEMSSGSMDGLPLPRRMSTNDSNHSTFAAFKPRSRSAASPRDSDTSVLRSVLGSVNALAAAPILFDSPRRTPSRRKAGSRSLPSSPWARSRPLDDDDDDDDDDVIPPHRLSVPSLHRSRSNPSLSRASSHQDLHKLPGPEFIRVRSRASSVKTQRAEPETESDSARDEDDTSTISHLKLDDDDTEDMNSLLIGPSVVMDADVRDADTVSQDGSEEARALDSASMI